MQLNNLQLTFRFTAQKLEWCGYLILKMSERAQCGLAEFAEPTNLRAQSPSNI